MLAKRLAPSVRMTETFGKSLNIINVRRFSNKPFSAGKGGLGVGIPRLPSIDAIKAVSSPQTKAPAPSLISMSKLKSEPNTFGPKYPYFSRLFNRFQGSCVCERILGTDERK